LPRRSTRQVLNTRLTIFRWSSPSLRLYRSLVLAGVCSPLIWFERGAGQGQANVSTSEIANRHTCVQVSVLTIYTTLLKFPTVFPILLLLRENREACVDSEDLYEIPRCKFQRNCAFQI